MLGNRRDHCEAGFNTEAVGRLDSSPVSTDCLACWPRSGAASIQQGCESLVMCDSDEPILSFDRVDRASP